MLRFSIPDLSGHKEIDFDRVNPADMERAAKMFAELVGEQKNIAAVRTPDGPRHTRSFDPNAEETVFYRPMAGG